MLTLAISPGMLELALSPALSLGVPELALSLGNHNNASAPAAIIVAGDFNIGPEDPMLDKVYSLGLKHIFHPTRNETECQRPLQDGGLGRCAGASYETTRPMSSWTMTPDHMFFTPQSLELVGGSARAGWELDHLSDHLPLIARFTPKT